MLGIRRRLIAFVEPPYAHHDCLRIMPVREPWVGRWVITEPRKRDGFAIESTMLLIVMIEDVYVEAIVLVSSVYTPSHIRTVHTL